MVSRGHMTWKRCPTFQKKSLYVLHVLFLSSAQITTWHGSVGSLAIGTDGKRTTLIVSVDYIYSHMERDLLTSCVSSKVSQSIDQNTAWAAFLLSEPVWAKESSNWTGPVSDSPSVLLMSETEPRPVQFWAEAQSLCHRVVVVVVVGTVHRSLQLSYHFYFVVVPFTHQASWC